MAISLIYVCHGLYDEISGPVVLKVLALDNSLKADVVAILLKLHGSLPSSSRKREHKFPGKDFPGVHRCCIEEELAVRRPPLHDPV